MLFGGGWVELLVKFPYGMMVEEMVRMYPGRLLQTILEGTEAILQLVLKIIARAS